MLMASIERHRETYGKVEDDEIGSCDGSQVLVGTSRLDDSLGGERDHTNTESFEDLNNDDLRLRVGALSESDHETIGQRLNCKPKDDDRLQSSEISSSNGGTDGDDGS